jgi:hypothetical protein
MARIRSIKPEFWTSEQVADCSPTARLLFIGLWSFCDDQGVHPASAKRIKMEVFPADSFTIEQMDGFIAELLNAGLLTKFTAEGDDFFAVTGWKHQKIEKPTNKYPAPPSRKTIADHSPTTSREVAEPSPPERKGEERKGEEKKDNRAANASLKADFKIWYDAFPLHVAPGEAERAYLKARKTVDAEILLAAARAYMAKPDRDIKFTKHPATWLNKQCWLDEQPSDKPTLVADPLAELKNLAWRVNNRMTNLAKVDNDTVFKLIQMGLTDEKRARAYGWTPASEFVPLASSSARVA